MADGTCEKCDNYYTDPRMLPCLHSFCLKCLEKELETKDTLQCPECNEVVPLPENGVAGLPQDLRKANEAEIERISEKVVDTDEQCENCGRTDSTGKAVSYCIECKEYLCKFCDGRHGKKELTASHTLVSLGQRLTKTDKASSTSRHYQKRLPCPHHKDHTIEAYCTKCEKLICIACISFEHGDHHTECKYLEKVAKQEMESLLAFKVHAKQALSSLDSSIATCKKKMEKVEERKKAVDSAITVSLEQVHKALMQQNESVRLEKIQGLEAQVQQLQKLRDGMFLTSGMIDKAQDHTPAQQLSTKKVLAERATKLKKEFESSVLLPSQSATFATDISKPAIISKMISLGFISVGGYAAHSTCDAGYLPRAVVGKPRTIKVVAIDKNSKKVSQGGDEVEARLVQKGPGGSAVTGKTTDNEDGTYSVSVTPESTGEHELQVTLANGHVKGSPFKYSVTSSRATPYTGLSAQNRFRTKDYPYDVAVTEEGYLAVTERDYHTVTLYSTTGQTIHTFGTAGSCGSANGKFSSPSAVAIRGDLMYVSEQNNHRVQKFSISKRSFISKFGSSGNEEGKFSTPRGICVDPQGKVFVADYGNNRVQVFNEDDSFAYSFPCQQNPWGMAFDHEGHLHVAAYGSHCIHVFTPEGALLTSYGTGTINMPAGIAIDAEGYIAISQYGGSSLWIYSPDHTHVHTLSGQFSSGVGIACDNNGSFWVADYENCRIVEY